MNPSPDLQAALISLRNKILIQVTDDEKELAEISGRLAAYRDLAEILKQRIAETPGNPTSKPETAPTP